MRMTANHVGGVKKKTGGGGKRVEKKKPAETQKKLSDSVTGCERQWGRDELSETAMAAFNFPVRFFSSGWFSCTSSHLVNAVQWQPSGIGYFS